MRAEARRRKIFLCGGEPGSCPDGAGGATRIGEMQGADAGRETACLLACLLACCVCTCGTIRECIGVVCPARRDDGGGRVESLYMAGQKGRYVVCVSSGNRRKLAIFFTWPQCVSCIYVCEPGGRRRRHADEVPRDLLRRRGDKQAGKQTWLPSTETTEKTGSVRRLVTIHEKEGGCRV